MIALQISAWAVMDISEKMQLQELLERRLTPIVHSVDLEGKVFVTLEEKKQEAKLAILPEFSKVNVLVVSRLKELPSSTKAMIRKLTRELRAPVVVNLSSTLASTKTEFSQSEPASVTIQGLESFKQIFAGFSDLLMALMGLVSFSAFLGAILFFKSKNSEGQAEKKEPAQTVASSWEGYTEDSWAAILSDCYWCEEDAYAAFLWQKVPSAQKKYVITSTAFLSKYLENVISIEGLNKDYFKHPYYLNPMSVNHLDNKTVTEMVRKHPSLLSRLSPMRRIALRFTAVERVRVEQEAALKAGAPDLMRLPADRERHFQPETLIPFVNIQEEEELLKIKDLSIELKARIPSLQWLCELSPDSRMSLLDSMSLRELAHAWVGPKAVLDVLSSNLPRHRKMELQGYLREIVPSRESTEFKKLHALSIEALKRESNASSRKEVA